MEIVASKKMELYFDELDKNVKLNYQIANEARKKGLDPEDEVSVPLAKNMSERVVGLISTVAPQILNTGIDKRIKELEEKYGLLDWRVALKISEEVAKEKFCKFKDEKEAIEVGIRIGFSYLTLGIVSAPLEGLVEIEIKSRNDNKKYLALKYAGPIRAAGGTASSVSVVLSDYVRIKMGYDKWDPTEKEISRYITEVNDYNDRVTNLQYKPSERELKFLLSHLPVEISGEPTEKIEVSNHKDIPRIGTNLIRGGVALVLAEGLSQKLAKVWKRLEKWGKEFDLEWDWLEELLKIKEEIHAEHGSKKEDESEKKVKPNNTFITDLVAGRPIITYPLAAGGFRLRYGRSRVSGFSTASINSATMKVLDDFIAIGTQMKVERPGKAASVSVCNQINGPIVKLKEGSVKYLKTREEAKEIQKDIEEILFLGDILIDYGDFSENGHTLVPPGYCPEWWAKELELKDKNNQWVKNPLIQKPTFEEALEISKKYDLALHPDYTFYWKLISGDQITELIEWYKLGKQRSNEKGIKKIILPYNEKYKNQKRTLELIGVPHLLVNKISVVIEDDVAKIFSYLFDQGKICSEPDGLTYINKISDLKIKDLAGTFIGARMGRPEKGKMRKMDGSPHTIFSVGEEGGRLRCFQEAVEKGYVDSIFPNYYCPNCDKHTIYRRCEDCDTQTIKKYHCPFCGDLEKETCRHGEANYYKKQQLDIKHYLQSAMIRSNEKIMPDLIKGIRGTSNKTHVMEHLIKGIFRAKHHIYVNKDGTVRYDCSEQPITHFKPIEIQVSVSKLKEIGYDEDINGAPLENPNQILELKPQDIILPGYDSIEDSASQVLMRTAKFIDDLLINHYGLDPFYNLKTKEDLVGQLVVGLAPHISAGLVGRIVGFSETQSLLAHPMFHAGMRRDTDGDEASINLLMDTLINFSRQYLPERRGAKTMDACLVLTSTLRPSEIDDQVQGLGVAWKYPLEFYQAAEDMKKPWAVKIDQLKHRLETIEQYENFGYTHDTDNFNKGTLCSSYKTLPNMEDKLNGQMELARKIRAVNMDDVAKLVIEKHFLKDIKGNLRKFSMQTFRCPKCNTKYRRPPLSGKCTVCKGKLIFTISEGSVVKYLGHSLNLSEKYNFPPYLKQTIELLKENVEHVFGKDKEKQIGLGEFC
jgi:DNA polymerase II large subunit